MAAVLSKYKNKGALLMLCVIVFACLFLRSSLDESYLFPQEPLTDLPEGMRTFTVIISREELPDRLLLYPGCVVDILYSPKLSGRAAPRGVINTMRSCLSNVSKSAGDIRKITHFFRSPKYTILQSITVLAVHGEQVKIYRKGESSASRATDKIHVTLLVNQMQAEALQLADDNGDISLALRTVCGKT